MRRADIRELIQSIAVGSESGGRTLVLRQEREAIINDVVRENAPIGILRGLRRIETQNVRQSALVVDRGNRFLAGVIARMPQQMHELFEPSRAVINRLAGVVLLFGVISVEEAADTWMAGSIDVNQPAL